jgi:hypothetical protein|tara:strand:- start:205 stop:483 length:279 start_codon:yes stop_codon:yes gene_type:complete
VETQHKSHHKLVSSQIAVDIIMVFFNSETNLSGTLLSPFAHAHLRSRLSVVLGQQAIFPYCMHFFEFISIGNRLLFLQFLNKVLSEHPQEIA